MGSKQTDRRRFLKSGAALAGLAVGASAGTGALAAEPAPERVTTNCIAPWRALAFRILW